MIGRVKKSQMDGLLALLVLSVFAVCILAVLLTGADTYGRLKQRDEASYDRRTAAQYLATKVRQADADGGVAMVTSFDGEMPVNGVGMWPTGGDTLFLEEIIDGAPYYTRVYYYDGYLRELFSDAAAEMAPEDGEKILEARGLTFDWTPTGAPGSLLTAEVTDADGGVERVVLSLRSGREGVS
ncbi:DUF4860 domain-containing protein [Oscillibacter sp.]|uniref:DUF4860 domain-containing protein n=1 Tax=Oscillibacter sp. TaxID=1945593 RepID=UPI00262B7700|nr:DUF4860 domain-containing protein [Oscillibacter sp.]MDD3347747.1 DUF4860 domain-containing protein [Oscillibacter sp.]